MADDDNTSQASPRPTPQDNPFVVLSSQRARAAQDIDVDADAELRAVKEDWIQRQLADRESEFCVFDDIKVFVGTWNVNGRDPEEELTNWLGEPGTADLYAIG